MAGYDPKIFIRDYGNPTYQMLAYQAGYTLAGADATLERALFLEAENQQAGEANIALSGDAAVGILLLSGDEAVNSLVISNPALFRLTGYDVAFLLNLTEIEALAGSYSLTGYSADLLRGYILAPDAGAYVLTGRNVEILRGLKTNAAAGSFALTGYDVILNLGYQFAVDPAAFALTGYNVSFRHDWISEAQTGTFSFTFRNVELIRALISPTQTGVFSLTGNDIQFYGLSTGEEAILMSGDMLDLPYDSLVLSGDAGPGYLLTSVLTDLIATAGAFNFTGNPVLFDRTIVAPSAAFTLTGSPAQIDTVKIATAGSFTLTGNPVTISRLLAPDAGVFTLTGNAVSFDLTLLDKLLVSGDAQTGADVIIFSGDESGALLQGYNEFISTGVAGAFALTGADVTFTLNVPVALSGDEQVTGNDIILLSGDEIGNQLVTSNA